MLCLGIDCGTQSLKGVAWDSESGSLLSASHSYDLIGGLPPGHKEQHPRQWLDALDAVIAGLRQKGADLSRVAAIGVSGQQHGLVALDAADEVIRPAKLWCDTSTGPECDQIREAAGGRGAYMREIGNDLPPGFTASKVRWLRNHEPDNYRRISSLLLPHDYLNFHLTGDKTSEAGDASGTGYFQVAERRWSRRALQWIDPERDLARCLPALIDSSQPAGRLRPQLAERWGLPRDVVVSSGGGDNMLGAIGSGNVAPGALTVSLGTSGTLFGYSPTPVLDPSGEIAALCDSTGGWLPLACTMNVTVATEMVRNGLEMGSLEAFNEAVDAAPAGAGGLLLLPYLEGERLPNLPEATGVLLGLRPSTCSPSQLARAAMEGATLGLRYGLERLAELGMKAGEVRLIGGGAASRVWRQIAADVFRMPVICPRLQEGPALGAALQACWCASDEEIAEIAARCCPLDESTRCPPREREADLYDRIYALQCDLSARLAESGLFGRHRRLIEGEQNE